MDLVTDYEKIIKGNTNHTINFLKKYYLNIDETNKKYFYTSINKYYTAMAIWNEKLAESNLDSNNEKLFENILYDYCSIIKSVINNDIKVVNFLLRNIIESFIRYTTLELNTRDLEGLFAKISKDIENNKQKELVQTYVSQLKQVYTEACSYIHTDVDKINPDMFSLLQLQNGDTKQDMIKLCEKFTRINIGMLCIMKILYKETFDSIKENVRDYLNFVVPLEQRIKQNEVEKAK